MNWEYGATASIQRHAILEQTSQAASVFTRMSGLWAGIVAEDDVDLPLPEIGIAFPLPEFYEDVSSPPDDELAGWSNIPLDKPRARPEGQTLVKRREIERARQVRQLDNPAVG